MAAAGLEFGVVALNVYGFLFFKDGGGGFEGDSEVDFLAVANAALDAAGEVGEGSDGAVLVFEDIVMFGALHLGTFKAATDFEAFSCRD